MFQLESNSIIGAALCFAVGFGACLLVVYYLLPALVHAQCVEIVREYLDYTRRESDIRIVVLDRESPEPLRKPRRVSLPARDVFTEPSSESQRHLRVDRPIPPASSAQVEPSENRSNETPDSMLSQIYEQNLHLQEQLRKQNRSVKD